MRCAVLSNVNADGVIKQLSKVYSVFKGEGYGNVFGYLLDDASTFYRYKPEIVCIVVDGMELLKTVTTCEEGQRAVDEWMTYMQRSMADDKV